MSHEGKSFDDSVALAAERLARNCDRRRFLARAATGAFAVMTSAAFLGREGAWAHTNDPTKGHCYYRDNRINCIPPHGDYCSGCNGHQCPNGYAWTTYWYPMTACWCTLSSGGRYKVCCDCVKLNSNGTPRDPSIPGNACGCYSVI